jgi:hypothetical protein
MVCPLAHDGLMMVDGQGLMNITCCGNVNSSQGIERFPEAVALKMRFVN